MVRRDFLKVGAFLIAFLTGGSGGVAARPLQGGPAIRRLGRHFLVDGWILTAEDLRALGLREPRENDL